MLTDAQAVSTLTPLWTVAATILGEARGRPATLLDRILVAQVVKNRTRNLKRYGHPHEADPWRAVCLRSLAFSCWAKSGGYANYVWMMALVSRIADQQNVMVDPMIREALWIAQGVMEDRITDQAHGADHYHAVAMVTPQWAVGLTPVITTDAHRYYAHVP